MHRSKTADISSSMRVSSRKSSDLLVATDSECIGMQKCIPHYAALRDYTAHVFLLLVHTRMYVYDYEPIARTHTNQNQRNEYLRTDCRGLVFPSKLGKFCTSTAGGTRSSRSPRV